MGRRKWERSEDEGSSRVAAVFCSCGRSPFFFVALLGERDIAARFFVCDLLWYVAEES